MIYFSQSACKSTYFSNVTLHLNILEKLSGNLDLVMKPREFPVSWLLNNGVRAGGRIVYRIGIKYRG
jgi:hypothetical protein